MHHTTNQDILFVFILIIIILCSIIHIIMCLLAGRSSWQSVCRYAEGIAAFHFAEVFLILRDMKDHCRGVLCGDPKVRITTYLRCKGTISFHSNFVPFALTCNPDPCIPSGSCPSFQFEMCTCTWWISAETLWFLWVLHDGAVGRLKPFSFPLCLYNPILYPYIPLFPTKSPCRIQVARVRFIPYLHFSLHPSAHP